MTVTPFLTLKKNVSILLKPEVICYQGESLVYTGSYVHACQIGLAEHTTICTSVDAYAHAYVSV